MQIGLSGTVLSPAATPQWLRDIESQLLIRNAVELKPSQSLFHSYTTLHTSVLRLQAVEDERQQLRMEHSRLTERIRELERAAADSSVQTSRERELEAKKDALQDQLQQYTQRESDYYKGLAEMKAVKEERDKLQLRSNKLVAELEQRTSELQLLHKEYTSLRDEYDRVRLTVSEADRYLRESKTANEKIVQLQYRIAALEAEVNMLRRRLQAALQGETAASVGEETRVNADEDGEGAEVTSTSIYQTASPHADPCTALSSNRLGAEPSRASMIIPDAHNGSTLHGLCVLDDGKHFLTSGTDKYIRLWNRRSAQAEKYFSSNSIALALDTTSHYLLAGCADHVVRFWDVNSLRVLEMTGHTEKVVAACLSSSVQHALTASSDSTIKLWDVRRRESLRTLLCESTCNDVTVAGDTVFSAHYNGKITAWDRRTAVRIGEVAAHQRVATCVRVSANGQLCVSMGKDNIISVRDARVFTKALFSIAPDQLTVMMNWARLAIAPSKQLCAVGSGRTSDLLLIPLDGAGEGNAEATGSASSSASVKVLKASVPNSPSRGDQSSSSSKGPIFSTAWGTSEGGPLVSISNDRCVQVWE
ncbi:hypothetical protein LSCM1_02637 [Leishmania martiniquensis]|uniref:Guanine nucleotide-binding protein subunit beta-like protein n=1 Tax=Leishmania martiniquensis TaxID=1580590 RepID=A0A836KKU8_9TRYP|nr:hypothetical protein LSCM1_02637 [Leishmania martiniquensis]